MPSSKFSPLLPDCHLHTRLYVPHIDTITRRDQLSAQLFFWSNYTQTDKTWEKQLPDNLRWRHAQIVECILVVLKRMVLLPVCSRDLLELCMLQKGWDSLMSDVETFFANPVPTFSNFPLSDKLTYINHYAQADCNILSHLYDHPPPIAQRNVEWGLDQTRPPVAKIKAQGEEYLPVIEAGPILTSCGDIPYYRCEVPGCGGAWWFLTALRRHQEEVPHKMVKGWCERDGGGEVVGTPGGVGEWFIGDRG